MEYISAINNDICTVMDTKLKQEKRLTKVELQRYVLQGNEVCGVNAQQDLFYELAVIGKPKTVTKARLGYKPKRIADSPIKYLIFPYIIPLQVLPEYEKNYFGSNANIYSLENGEIVAQEEKFVLLPKFKGLPILIEEGLDYISIDKNQARINTLHLHYQGRNNEILCKEHIDAFRKSVKELDNLASNLPLLVIDKNFGNSPSADIEQADIQQKIDELGGVVRLKFADNDKIFVTDSTRHHQHKSWAERKSSLGEALKILNTGLPTITYSDIDVSEGLDKDLTEYVSFYPRHGSFVTVTEKDFESYKGEFCKISFSDTAVNFQSVTYKYGGKRFVSESIIQFKHSEITEVGVRAGKLETYTVNSLDGIWEIDMVAFSDWVNRGRLSGSAELAKMALLYGGTL